MTKSEFVKAVVSGSETELSVKDAEKIVATVFQELGRIIARDGRFAWPGFGTFTVRERAARKGRNPGTGESIQIKASRTVAFKPAPTLKGGL